MARLAGKIALITGGTTGIGYECARLFRDEGATVIVTGANAANVATAERELGIAALHSDGSDLDATTALMATIKERFGRLDILFANAGLGEMRPIEAVDSAYFDRMFGLNVRGLYFTVQHALPLLGEGASVILTASVAAHMGAIGGTVYAATKAAVRSIGRSFGAELAPRGIRVNTLSPGPVDTPILGKSGMPREVALEMLRNIVPIKRVGTPLEVANAALFLASDESSYMTASEIIVGGGVADI